MQYDCIKKIGEMDKQTKSPGILLLRYNCLLLLWDLVLKSEMSFIEKIKTSENDVNLGCTSHFVQRRQWHPTPVLLPGQSHGRRSLVGCSPWGCWGSYTTSLSFFTFMHWRRKWQPTPVFLPGESQGRGSLVGCRLWDHTESDTTEAT